MKYNTVNTIPKIITIDFEIFKIFLSFGVLGYYLENQNNNEKQLHTQPVTNAFIVPTCPEGKLV